MKELNELNEGMKESWNDYETPILESDIQIFLKRRHLSENSPPLSAAGGRAGRSKGNTHAAPADLRIPHVLEELVGQAPGPTRGAEQARALGTSSGNFGKIRV